MKILMTGFTPRGVNSAKTLYEYTTGIFCMKEGLLRAGHEIDHRAVSLTETGLKDKYDVAMIALAVPQSLSSRYIFGALWTMEQFGPERTRFFVDDYLLHQFQSQLQSFIKSPEKRLYSLDNRADYALAKGHTDIWMKWIKFLAASKYKLLMPCFAWGKPRLLLPKLDNIQPVIFDPTPLSLVEPQLFWRSNDPIKVTVPPPEERQRRWTLAAMRDNSAWMKRQSFEWPVDRYGNKRLNEPVILERALVDVYCKNWGILGSPYESVSGGGGWRARYVHAAVTDSILFLDPEEGRVAGKPYDLYRTVVERASNDELAEIALRQKVHLIERTWTLDQLISALDAYVKGDL